MADNNRSFDQGWYLDRQLKLSLKEGQAILPICFGGELPAHSQLEQKKESKVMERDEGMGMAINPEVAGVEWEQKKRRGRSRKREREREK